MAIVFPKTTEQVQAIVLWANAHNVALVPSGGRTGLSAAAVAANGEVVVLLIACIGTLLMLAWLSGGEAFVHEVMWRSFTRKRNQASHGRTGQRNPPGQ